MSWRQFNSWRQFQARSGSDIGLLGTAEFRPAGPILLRLLVQVGAHGSGSGGFPCLATELGSPTGNPWTRGCSQVFPPKCSHPRVKEAFLVEMLEIGPHIADENEGGCHEATHFCINRGALRCALSYSTGTTRDAKLSRGARERVQV